MNDEPDIEELKAKIGVGIKFWLEFEKKSILGHGWAQLLENIEKNKDGSLTQALNIEPKPYSYKYAWNILKRIEERTGMSPVITGKGGRGGGGWIKLNEWGRYLLKMYKNYESAIKNLSEELKKS